MIDRFIQSFIGHGFKSPTSGTCTLFYQYQWDDSSKFFNRWWKNIGLHQDSNQGPQEYHFYTLPQSNWTTYRLASIYHQIPVHGSIYSKTSPYNHPENTTNPLLRTIFFRTDFFFHYHQWKGTRKYGQPVIPELRPPFSVPNEFYLLILNPWNNH